MFQGPDCMKLYQRRLFIGVWEALYWLQRDDIFARESRPTDWHSAAARAP
jgi:hypothetical protein